MNSLYIFLLKAKKYSGSPKANENTIDKSSLAALMVFSPYDTRIECDILVGG